MRVIRSFHPVGQGAFYSEIFLDARGCEFSVVYDCGSESNGLSLYEEVNDFRKVLKGNKIDLLFISHFHSDHINGLLHLLKGIDVDKVVIPMLTDEAITITRIQNYLRYSRNSDFVDDFIRTVYYGAHSVTGIRFKEIIAISPVIIFPDNNEDIEKGAWFPFGRTIIKSGETIQVQNAFWEYIPFNSISLSDSRTKAFQDQLFKNPKFKELSLEEIVINHRKELKELYKQTIGSENDNIYTLCVESKPAYGITPRPNYRLSKCLYLGDFETNTKRKWNRFLTVYIDYKDIGTIQVPHHGSKNNWRDELFDSNGYRHYVISAGSKNKYHHPNYWVIRDIEQSGYDVSVVSEEKSSECVFEFEF